MKAVQFWIATVVGLTAVAAAGANIALVLQNRSLQTDVNGRAQYIQQSVQLQGLYQEILKALADLAVRNKDEQLKSLLAREGFTVSVAPAAPATALAAGKGKP